MIGENIRAQVFRDTKNFYRTFPADAVAHQLILFTQRHAGNSVLDLGCATGNYCIKLGQLGYRVTGADVNPEYVAIARERGVDAHLIETTVPFPDGSFDTVIVFEVLEHLPDPEAVISEARRLARKNVLFTVPHSGGMERLQPQGLIFEHFADLDHKNFFTEDSLKALLQPHFRTVTVTKGDGISPFSLFNSRWIRFGGKVLTKLGIVRPQYHFRLYARGEV